VTGALAAVAALILLGFPAVRLIDRDAAGARLAASSFLVGAGIAPNVLLLLSAAGIAWRPYGAAAATAATAAVLWMLLAAREGLRLPKGGRSEGRRCRHLENAGVTIVWLVILLLLAGHAAMATVAPPPEADFLAIWGLKAKTFWLSNGIDLEFIRSMPSDLSHPDYPLLVPLLFDFTTYFIGAWEPRWLGILYTATGLALLLLVHGIMRRETTPLPAAVATLALLPAALSPWIGLAEAFMVAFGTAGLLFIREGIEARAAARIHLGAVFLGLAAQSKNEGSVLVAAAAIAVAATTPRLLLRLWPAVALALPWNIARSALDLPVDLWRSSPAERIAYHLQHLGELTAAIASQPVGNRLLWLAVLVALVIGFRDLVRRSRVVVVAITVQFATYLIVYLTTSHDITWQVRWSWERLVAHVTLPLAFVVLASALRTIDGVRARIVPEAGSREGSSA
jgi:hypothetical protein